MHRWTFEIGQKTKIANLLKVTGEISQLRNKRLK